MAKRLQTKELNPIKTLLIVKRDYFKQQLLDRIALGRAFYNRTIQTVPDIEQLRKDYYDWNDYNSELLKASFNTIESEYKVSYDSCTDKFLYTPYTNAQEQLTDYKNDIEKKLNNLERLVNKLDLIESEINESTTDKSSDGNNEPNKTDVFIVHGHNSEKKLEVFVTLKSLGLNPIILHEQPNNGKTIIEKFEANSNVGYAVVLLTDDDDGKSKKSEEYQSRARQNVILELGYFIGKLGRSRVCPLYSEGVELPNDLSGVVYTPLDSAGSWKYSVA